MAFAKRLAVGSGELGSVAEFGDRFRAIAEDLLNSAVVDINGTPHRLGEIEFYFNGGAHKDIFTHGSEEQSKVGQWYFHKQGQTYKNGTYKGLDITIGESKGAPGGILVRALEDVGSGKVVEGPSKTVDHILALNKVDSIKSCVAKMGTIDISGAKGLTLRDAKKGELAARKVYSAPRVGLTYRKAGQEEYHMLPYRFSTTPDKLAKMKVGFALTMHHNGSKPAEIMKATGMNKSVMKMLEGYDEAKKGKDYRKVANASLVTSAGTLASIYGSWAASPYSKGGSGNADDDEADEDEEATRDAKGTLKGKKKPQPKAKQAAKRKRGEESEEEESDDSEPSAEESDEEEESEEPPKKRGRKN